jgi:23S rRNA-/tRNA-specific pseudouridylate synthase
MIGFPPPLLGDVPLRLPVIGEAGGWLALEKPAGVGLREHPWYPGVPDLDAALNKQLLAEKPELLRREAALFGSVYYLDPEISGVAVFAKSRESLADLRNHFGSGNCFFRFLFVTRAGIAGGAREIVADAPLLPHNTKPKMIPSTAKGKKTVTNFRLLCDSDAGWALWEATSAFLRPHQVRAHASVVGVPVMGDELYEGPSIPILSELLPNKRTAGIRFPVFNGVALHLREVRLPENDGLTEPFQVQAELPRHFRVLLQRMRLTLPEGL